ncbi:MAG: sodium:solute symporter [Flavobacteriales bacterium]|nr:sodium:solute symporter [Flavobacteriales bacterium]MCB9192899.1 sodium:solute symporter [Flavobacteriales bacterium]
MGLSTVDWIVMAGTLLAIVGYGTWHTRRTRTREGYLRGGNADRWWAVGFGVMATQLSAVTFLSTPGQGFLDGMRFVQFYFGLPLAMVVISAVFIPLYYKWKVYTAYEFIGRRFDRRMRLFTAILFLIQRSMAAGITIYAPSIILSKVLGWSFTSTFLITGLVILYTTVGGARAVSATQTIQMSVIFLGMFLALGLVVHCLGERMTFVESLRLAGATGRMDIIRTDFNANDRYTLWTGLLGGFFLQLSYFGTDQSQVGRYLSGRTVREARLGMMFTGLMKVPLQFTVLLTGVLVFVFYLIHPAPLHWNARNLDLLHEKAPQEMAVLDGDHATTEALIETRSTELLHAFRNNDPDAITAAREELSGALQEDRAERTRAKMLLQQVAPEAESRDDDHIFITFIMRNLPVGVVGLLLAVMFSAAMSTMSAELNALATTTTVDVVRHSWTDAQAVLATRWATVLYGVLAMGFATLASYFGNLIQAVNIVGSLFYGTILGIFLVAFFLKHVKGNAVFIAAIAAEMTIVLLFVLERTGHMGPIAFLWYNLIAPAIVVVLSWVLHAMGIDGHAEVSKDNTPSGAR